MLRQELNDSNVYFLKNLKAEFDEEARLSAAGIKPEDQDILDSAVNEEDDSLHFGIQELLQRQSVHHHGMPPHDQAQQRPS